MNSELEKSKNDVKEMMKKLRGTKECNNVEELQKDFEALLAKVPPLAIAVAEQELLNEGYTFEDLKNSCDVHLALFKGSFENNRINVPKDHPIFHFQEEHRAITRFLEKLRAVIKEASSKSSKEEAKLELETISKIARKLMEAESHNVRQENTLFPILEKHGITAPPAVMWEEHTEMKEQKKAFLKKLEKVDEFPFKEFLDRLDAIARILMEKFFKHSQKENNILYETALRVITEEEWKDIKEECDNLGYFKLEMD
jgi:DUF438 domain-containing protein